MVAFTVYVAVVDVYGSVEGVVIVTVGGVTVGSFPL
jgi:hypothetical protein